MLDLDILSFVITNSSEVHSFNWVFVIKHVLNLGILIGVLVYFLRIPIKGALERRKENLSREIDEARQIINDAKVKYDEYTEKIEKLGSEIKELKDSISMLGETEKDEIIVNARQTCELIKKDSKETIELEAFRAKQEIQEEVVKNSLEIAENLIKEKMDDSYNSKAVDNLIDQIEDGKWLQ